MSSNRSTAPKQTLYVFEDVNTAESESTFCWEIYNIWTEDRGPILTLPCCDVLRARRCLHPAPMYPTVACLDSSQCQLFPGSVCAANLSYEPISSEAREHLEAG